MPSSPATFEHFEVARHADGSLHELGRGAMGVTYKAFDTRLGSYVALKVVNADAIKSEVGRVRFEREAKAAAHLNHPNVASIFHRGQGGGTYFYAMQFIEGETFDAFVKRRGPLPAALAMRLILQAAQGLAAASTRGLIHRDIKPANLMLVQPDADADPDDEELLVKVIDFGLAKYLNKPGDPGDVSLTGDRIVGTPYYMSPEQIDPVGKEIDARADIYSLGVTLWHLLCGTPPFRGTEFQVLSQHMHNSLPWERLPSTVPPLLHDLLERMMAKDPADRPASHRELVGLIKQQLRTLAGGAAPGLPAAEGAAGPGQRQDVVEQSTGLPLPPADFSMADVLDRRGALTMGEVLGLLSLLAPVVDAKREQEGQAYDLTPGRVCVRFDSPPPPGADLAAQPLGSWPPSQLEIATLAVALTAEHPAQALGALTYELLAGHPPEVEYRPAAGVNARGNAVLRQILEATDTFGTAVRFAEAFRLSLAGELHVPGSSAAVVVADTDAWKSDTREYPAGGSLLTRPIGRRRGLLVRLAPLFILLLALAVGGWWYAKRRGIVPVPEWVAQAATLPHVVTPASTPTGPWAAPEGATTTRAVRRYSPPPFFPPAAKAARQHGTVLLDVGVDAAGNVTGSTVMQSSGFPLLDEAARQAVGVWKFDPARTNEVAVPSRTAQSIEFKPPPAGVPPEPPGR